MRNEHDRIAWRRRYDAAKAKGVCTKCRRRKRRKRTPTDHREPLLCLYCAQKNGEYAVAYDKRVKRRKYAENIVVQLAEEAVIKPRRHVVNLPPPSTLEI